MDKTEDAQSVIGIDPGRVYENRNGTRYLYLGKLDIGCAGMPRSRNADGGNGGSLPRVRAHRYLKITKAVQAAMDAYPDANMFLRAMSLTDKLCQSWLLKCSCRNGPRKFARAAEKALDFTDVHEEAFIGAMITDAGGERHWLEYTVRP